VGTLRTILESRYCPAPLNKERDSFFEKGLTPDVIGVNILLIKLAIRKLICPAFPG
jgi:hypothetical protein